LTEFNFEFKLIVVCRIYLIEITLCLN